MAAATGSPDFSLPVIPPFTTTTTTTTASGPPSTAGSDSLLRPVMDLIRHQSRELRYSLRVQRDIIVDGWAGRFDDLAEQVAEDKRQARAHYRRTKHAIDDRIIRLKETGERRRTKGANAFPQFTRLPAEIRLQIWEAALPGARAVMLRAPYTAADSFLAELRLLLPHILGDEPSVASLENEREKNRGWTSSTPVPALLHACAESRVVALKRYSLILGSEGAPPRIFADLTRDVICLSGKEVSPRCSALWRRTADLGRIRHLAVAGCPWASWSSVYGSSAGFAQSLPPADLLGSAFLALEDVVMVRSVRWQYGRLPGGAARDFESWAAREEADDGLSRWYTRWRNGVMVIRDARRKSMEHSQQQQGSVQAGVQQ